MSPVNYDLLRRGLVAYCRFDDIRGNDLTQEYFDRLDRGEPINKTLRNFIQEHVHLKQFRVNVNGQWYPVKINSDFKGEVCNATKGVETRTQAVLVAKRILVCLANLRQVLEDGQKTGFVSSVKKKHGGARWLYIKEFCADPGIRGEVVLELRFPISEPGSPRVNTVYHLTARGAKGFRNRLNVVNENSVPKGYIKVSFVA